MLDVIADCFEETQGAERVGVGGVLGELERDLDVRLGAEIVDFVGKRLFDDAAEDGESVRSP